MQTVLQNDTFIIEFNGSNTWLVSYIDGDCIGYFPTERRALNCFNKSSDLAGAK